MLYILVTFVRCLKCGIKCGHLNLAQWPSNSSYFIYMEKSLFNIAYYVCPRSINKQQPPFGAKICSDICPWTLSVPSSEQFSESIARGKTVSYEEQLMSKDKYPSIFSPQMQAIVFISHQIFYATRAFLKIGKYPRIFPSFSWGIFAHVTRLDQSCVSENI